MSHTVFVFVLSFSNLKIHTDDSQKVITFPVEESGIALNEKLV